MRTRKYLKRAVGIGNIKPVISWGFRFQDEDECWVCVASDGYRVHLVWDDEQEALSDGTMPYSTSRPFVGGQENVDKVVASLKTMLSEARAREYDCNVSIVGEELRRCCCKNAESAHLMVLGNSLLYIDNARRALYQPETAIVHDAPNASFVVINPRFLRDAVFEQDERITIRFTMFGTTPLLLGNPGKYAALPHADELGREETPYSVGRKAIGCHAGTRLDKSLRC